MLLRARATGEFRPVGATRSRTVDVRVVSATNRPLNQLVMTNQFRYDLLFRLRQFHIAIPPLRERGDDWRLLADYWLARLARQYGVAKRFSAASMRVLERCQWPGNVRQLIGVVKTAYAMADSSTIEPHLAVAQVAQPGCRRAARRLRQRAHGDAARGGACGHGARLPGPANPGGAALPVPRPTGG